MDSLALAKLFVRFAELCFALMTLWWIHGRLPLAGEFFRRLSGVLVSPLFVFVLCHIIVVSLMADSGKFSLRSRIEQDNDYKELKNDVVSEANDEVIFEDKQVISESTIENAIKAEEQPEEEIVAEGDSTDLRHYRRWRSENFERASLGENLRRSESEKCLTVVVFSGDDRSHENLSDEDFNRTVEDFIAKQLKFRRQEHSPELTRFRASVISS